MFVVLMAIRDNGVWETDAGKVYEIIKSDKTNGQTGMNELLRMEKSELMCW